MPFPPVAGRQYAGKAFVDKSQYRKPGEMDRQQKRRAFARRFVSMDCRVKPGNDSQC
jgi:hypothetical protein